MHRLYISLILQKGEYSNLKNYSKKDIYKTQQLLRSIL